MADRDTLEQELTVALKQFKLMSAKISYRIRRCVNLDNIGMLSVIVWDLCGIINTAQDNWVLWSMTLETDDQGIPVMPGYGSHGYIFRDTNFQELLSNAEGVIAECKLHLVRYKASHVGQSAEIAEASCLQVLQGGAEEIMICAKNYLLAILPLFAPVIQPAVEVKP